LPEADIAASHDYASHYATPQPMAGQPGYAIADTPAAYCDIVIGQIARAIAWSFIRQPASHLGCRDEISQPAEQAGHGMPAGSRLHNSRHASCIGLM